MNPFPNCLLFQYINTYYKSYVIDLKQLNRATLRQAWGAIGAFGLALGGVASNSYAEVRLYDPNESQSQLSVPRGTSTTNSPTSAFAPSAMAVKPGVARVDPSDSTYVAAMQMIAPKPSKLGSARVFIKADDLTPEMVDHLKEIKALEDLHSEFYFQDVKPVDLVKLFSEKVKDYPQDMVFNVDFEGKLATELQVKGKNVIVYTDPKGVKSQYELNSTYSFKTAIERIKQGVAN